MSADEPLARAPWREVARSERRDNSKKYRGRVGGHWFVTLACGHIVIWPEKKFQLLPRKMRCRSCADGNACRNARP